MKLVIIDKNKFINKAKLDLTRHSRNVFYLFDFEKTKNNSINLNINSIFV
jgi:hypothetical protein